MNIHTPDPQIGYCIDIQPLAGRVTARRNGVLLASSTNAKVMYETRLSPTTYFPAEDVSVDLGEKTSLQTFCPFKGTASYRDMKLDDQTIANAVWSYDNALPESLGIQGHVGFMPSADVIINMGDNTLNGGNDGHISGPVVDWLLRGASELTTPEGFTAALARKLSEQGVAISRFSVLIWSLHPQIAGKNYIWKKGSDEVTT